MSDYKQLVGGKLITSVLRRTRSERVVGTVVAALLISTAGCAKFGMSSATENVAAIEKAAHEGYVAAINTNDVDKILDNFTDDVVIEAPGEPATVGKDAVRRWLTDFLGAYSGRYVKTPHSFTVSGDWAFERYTYNDTLTERKTGETTRGIGKGIIIFHKDDDGKWRVAIDGWSSDEPTP